MGSPLDSPGICTFPEISGQSFYFYFWYGPVEGGGITVRKVHTVKVDNNSYTLL